MPMPISKLSLILLAGSSLALLSCGRTITSSALPCLFESSATASPRSPLDQTREVPAALSVPASPSVPALDPEEKVARVRTPRLETVTQKVAPVTQMDDAGIPDGVSDDTLADVVQAQTRLPRHDRMMASAAKLNENLLQLRDLVQQRQIQVPR